MSKRVYITEKQYVDYVLFEYSKLNVLNESAFDFKKLAQTLYRGCKTFSDYARRTTYIASAGVLSLALLHNIIATDTLPINDAQKQDLITRVDSAQNEKQDIKPTGNIIDLNFHISNDGIEHIKQYEKCSLTPYFATEKEKAGRIKTIGWGHKIIPSDPSWITKADSITQEQADALFANDIKVYENELAEAFKSLPKYLQNAKLYPQGFIDACISIIYNCGRGNFKASPLFKTLSKCRVDGNGDINKDDLLYTCNKMKSSCIDQKGKVLDGLVKRRNKESLMAQQQLLSQD